jgi:large subunit ribosomal protein L24
MAVKKKLHVKKNDMVMIMAGKEKGKTGKIIKVFTVKGRVLVENLNVVKRHSRPTRANAQGGIIEKEAPLASSNVLLLCAACSKPTRTGMRMLEDGSKARFCKKCNEIVDR